MDLKKPKSYSELVSRLEEHNMIVENRSFAEGYLRKVNYYRFTGYALQFRVAPHDSDYVEGTTFEKVSKICDFDSELRGVLRKWIEVLEIFFRTQISHSFSMAKCLEPPHDQHYDIENYHYKELVKDIISNFNKHKARYKDTLVLQHHQNKYGDKFPLWAITEMLSFSDLSKLYNCMHDTEKDLIATEVGTKPTVLKNHLHCITVLRNRCAHAARLYNTDYKPAAKLSKRFLRKNRSISNSSLFAYILVVIRRLPEDSMKLELIEELHNLIKSYEEAIELDLLGFPVNFKEILTENR